MVWLTVSLPDLRADAGKAPSRRCGVRERAVSMKDRSTMTVSQHMKLDSATYAELGAQAYFERIDEWLAETP